MVMKFLLLIKKIRRDKTKENGEKKPKTPGEKEGGRANLTLMGVRAHLAEGERHGNA